MSEPTGQTATPRSTIPRPRKPAPRAKRWPVVRLRRRRTRVWIGVGAVILVAVATVGYVVFADRWTTSVVAGISLRHPGEWVRQGPPDVATFSPLQPIGHPPGATQDDWQQIIAALGSDPSKLVGVYVGEHNEPRFRSGDLATLKTAVAGVLSGSRATLQAPQNADQLVAGRPAVTLDGDIRPWDSTDSLRIRSYVISLDSTTGRSTYIMFFAAPTIFEESQDTFTKVLATVTVTAGF